MWSQLSLWPILYTFHNCWVFRLVVVSFVICMLGLSPLYASLHWRAARMWGEIFQQTWYFSAYLWVSAASCWEIPLHCFRMHNTILFLFRLSKQKQNSTRSVVAAVLQLQRKIVWMYTVVKLGGGSRGISTPPPLIWDPPPLTTDLPPLILDPPHFTRKSLSYCACLNAPFDLFQLFNHRAPHTMLWTKTDFSSARLDGMLYACSKLFPESDKRIV